MYPGSAGVSSGRWGGVEGSFLCSSPLVNWISVSMYRMADPPPPPPSKVRDTGKNLTSGYYFPHFENEETESGQVK